MGTGQRNRRQSKTEFVACKQCGYAWNFKKNSWCYSCRSSLQPSQGRPPPPGGVWAEQPAGGAKDGKGAGKGGGEDRSTRPWRADAAARADPPRTEIDEILSCPDPALREAARVAIEAARASLKPPEPLPPPKSLEQRLQSATDRRLNARRSLDEAAESMAATEAQLAEARQWRDDCATALAEAQAEEAALLRLRAQESGVSVDAGGGGSKSVSFNFDVSQFEEYEELEEGAQEALRKLCEEGHAVMLSAQAAFEENCSNQLSRIKQEVEKLAKKRRLEPPASAAAEVGGAPAAAGPAASAAEEPPATTAGAQPAGEARAPQPEGDPEAQRAAAALGAAASEAARQAHAAKAVPKPAAAAKASAKPGTAARGAASACG